jgi:hypothetical protein
MVWMRTPSLIVSPDPGAPGKPWSPPGHARFGSLLDRCRDRAFNCDLVFRLGRRRLAGRSTSSSGSDAGGAGPAPRSTKAETAAVSADGDGPPAMEADPRRDAGTWRVTRGDTRVLPWRDPATRPPLLSHDKYIGVHHH